MNVNNYVIERFDANKAYTNVKTFNCGNEIINKTTQNLKAQVKDGNIVAYVVIDLSVSSKEFIVGFYTVSAYAIAKTTYEHGLRNATNFIPCNRLIMLGVDNSHQGKSLGKLLMKHAFKQTIETSDKTGIRGLYLDAVKGKHQFYEALGFRAIQEEREDGTLPMFINIETLKVAV